MKKNIFIITLLAIFLSLSFPLGTFASELERISHPDQIKYFRVVKKEGGALYGIRLANTKIQENKIEAITHPSQIKYFKIVKQEKGTLYGIRIVPLEKEEEKPNNSISENFAEIDGKLRMTQGKASWYRYKNGLFAASPDYPKGSVLKVTNLSNGKAVEITVNDFGPERNIHPDRVIDLDYVAFSELASPGAGIIEVKVEPISIKGSNFKPENKSELEQEKKAELEAEKIKNQTSEVKKEEVTNSNTSNLPEISALAAIVLRESDGAILYEKNSEKVLPIASLTKLVFAKVFLDLNPDFNKVVTYKKEDAEFNHQYVIAGQESRLRITDGDTLTIGDLFYASIIGSANNTVETLVRNSGLSRDEFIKRMNNYVKTLGATNTKFIEPTGLAPENVSSPSDYAIIAREVFKDKKLESISAKKTYSFSTINSKKNFNLKNTNQLLATSSYAIIGSKTGYLDESGYCLVTQVQKDNEKFIVINFNSATRDLSYKVNEALIEFGLKK